MKSDFRKISRVGSLLGGTKWYLSHDCLLAAKRSMYVVEYRRFYLRNLESIVIWRSRFWLVRLVLPGLLLAALSVSLWQWVNSIAGGIFAGICLAWIALELALGPTAKSRICATGTSVDLPLVKRTRRARKVLAQIDEAIHASRDLTVQSAVPIPSLQPAGISLQTNSETASPALADASPPNAF